MLTTSYPPAAGVPNGAFVHRLAARLVAAGHQVDVLAPHAEGAHSRVEDGVRSHFFRYAPSRLELLAYGPGMVYNLSVDRRRLALLPSFAAAFAVAAARHARRADVVHGHWLPAGMVARVTRRPFVTTVHGSDLALAERVPALVRATLSNHVTIAVSEEMRRELSKLAPNADIRVVPPGGVEFPARPYSDATPGRLLFVGRLVDVKGVDTLMSAWPAIKAAHPHATLDVVGVGPLAELVHGDGVRLLGRVRPNEIAGLYADAAAVRRAVTPRLVLARLPGGHGDGAAGGLHAGGRHGDPRARRHRRARRAARRPRRRSNGGRSAACRSGRRGDDGTRGAPPCGGALLVGRDRAGNARCLRGRDYFLVSRTANQIWRFFDLWLFG